MSNKINMDDLERDVKEIIKITEDSKRLLQTDIKTSENPKPKEQTKIKDIGIKFKL